MAEKTHKEKKHKIWRKEVKKLRRKRIRQALAEERNKLAAKEETARLNDPIYIKWLREQEELENHVREQEELRQQEQEERWLRRELLARKKFREQQQKLEATAAIKEAERLRIQKEFEELQQKAQQRREERKRREEQAKQEHEHMMGKIFDYIELGGAIPEELASSVHSNPNKPVCPFFMKTNACRFGMQCTRNHIRPRLSRILFIPNFFSHIKLDGGRIQLNDINLECSDEDLNRDYKVFFEDVTEELQKFGEILNFRTCMNTQPHLRGNVYVEYTSERSALKAYAQLQGRFYARKQINVEFSAIASWRSAICGLFFSNNCPKGRDCNFMHILKNPGNRFNKTINKQDECMPENLRKQPKDNTAMSWNDGSENKTRKDWRWSESPEPSSKTDKRESNSKETRRRERDKSSGRHRSRERSHRRDDRNHKDRSSSRSSRHSRRHNSSRRKDGKKSRSRSPSDSRSSRDNGKRVKESESKDRSSSRSSRQSNRNERKRSKSKSPMRSQKHHKDDGLKQKHHKDTKRKHKTKE